MSPARRGVPARSSAPSRRSVLAAALGLPPAVLAAGCSGAGSAAGRRTVDASPEVTRSATPTGTPGLQPQLDVRNFGAVGDGRTDDTTALTRAFAALRPGQTLVVPAGHTFCHSAVLAVKTAGVHLTGTGTLSATAEATSSVQVLADNVTVSSLTLTTPATTRRWSAPDQHKLFLGQVTGTAVRQVTIVGSAAAGVFSYGASGFTIEDVSVNATRADGIHLTNGSTRGRVLRPRVSHTGDDGVAVVSYEQDGRICSDITVSSPVIRNLDGGRGLSVVGGRNVSYTDIDVVGSWAAAVYLACEGDPYNTFATSAVTVTGGRISDANTSAEVDHGAVLVFCGRSGGEVSDVTVSGLTITDTRSGASRQIGAVADGGGQVDAVRFQDLRLDATPTPYEGNVAVADVEVTGVVAAGRPVAATLTP